MASQKSAKADLLVRVRYQNPLPAPPFPPKLVNIPTGPQRYATYDFLSPIQGERELPLILDSELGLPLEYGKPHEGARGDGEYWMGNRTGAARLLALQTLRRRFTSLGNLLKVQNVVTEPFVASVGIAPAPAPGPIADEDAFMFEDATPRGAAGPSSATGSIPGTPGRASVTEVSKKVDVSWLRKTEYLSSEASSQRQALQAMNGYVQSCLSPTLRKCGAHWPLATQTAPPSANPDSTPSTATAVQRPSPPPLPKRTSPWTSCNIRPSGTCGRSRRSSCSRTTTCGRTSTT